MSLETHSFVRCPELGAEAQILSLRPRAILVGRTMLLEAPSKPNQGRCCMSYLGCGVER